jgi:hypothetical protein
VADLDLYDVPVRGHVTQMKLTKEDAELYGAKKVGSVKPAEPQPVSRPPYAVDADEDEEPQEKSASSRNKSRTASNK